MFKYLCRTAFLPALLAAALIVQDAQNALAFRAMPASPATAFFYPDEVQVTVEESGEPETLPAGGAGFILALPSNVKQDSFLLTVGGAPAGGWFWLTKEQQESLLAGKAKRNAWGQALLPENEQDPERKALLQNLAVRSDEAARLDGELAGVEARLALLRKTLESYGEGPAPLDGKNAPSYAEEAAKLDAVYAKNYPALHKERARLQSAMRDAVQLRQDAEKRLADYDRREGVVFLAVPFEGKAGSRSLRYSYVLPARSELSYRLNALPDTGEVVVSQDAALTQRSGLNWDKTDVYVSTIRRDSALSPGLLHPWVVAVVDKTPPPAEPAPPKPAPAKMRARAEMSKLQAPLDSAFNEAFADAQEYRPPVAEDYATYRVWNVGPKRLDNDSPLRLSLSEQRLPAVFLYTLRPSVTPRGFLTARLELKEALELPSGMAQFAVDGASVGRQRFSFNGDKGDIFFGSDPRVTAVMRDLQRSSGEEGFFNKDATQTRHWQITVHNSRQRAVEARVEDPAPDSRDNSIIIKTTSSPKPELVVMEPGKGGAKVFRWDVSVEPGTPMLIDHKVEIAAPVDKTKELHPGR